jgi:fatty-acyl-CoA synthase
VPAAFIIPRSGANITTEDVVDHCRGQIAFYKIPRHVHFLDEYPLTASGKIMKKELRKMGAELWPDP